MADIFQNAALLCGGFFALIMLLCGTLLIGTGPNQGRVRILTCHHPCKEHQQNSFHFQVFVVKIRGLC